MRTPDLMRARSLCLILALALSGWSLPSVAAHEVNCEATGGLSGNSTQDRIGCLDSDGDGWSDPDGNWTLADGADRWPSDNRTWSDGDGDGYADQPGTSYSDDCPMTFGTSRVRLFGCSDMDDDWVPDIYDDDADGDGIRNEMERAASTGIVLYDPYDPNSRPLDTDQDTIPDLVDSDNDNDGWPDDVEYDRGSDPFDEDETPFTMYGGNTGFFYLGGLGANSFDTGYHDEGQEFSMSGVREVVFEELVIPLLLIPIYISLFVRRRLSFRILLNEVEMSRTVEELKALEIRINDLLRRRQMKVYYGLVLRNAIEAIEDTMAEDDQVKGLSDTTSTMVDPSAEQE